MLRVDERNTFRDAGERVSGCNVEFRVRSVLAPGGMVKNLVPAIPGNEACERRQKNPANPAVCRIG
jgi:hypothetical protein